HPPEALEIGRLPVDELDLDLDEAAERLEPVEDVDRIDGDVGDGVRGAADAHPGAPGAKRGGRLESLVPDMCDEEGSHVGRRPGGSARSSDLCAPFLTWQLELPRRQAVLDAPPPRD